MTRLLDLLARAATRIPALTLLLLLLATVALGAAASSLEVDTGLEAFAPEEGAAATLEAIEDRFATTTSVQVLVDDGPGGNVLEQDTLADAVELRERLEDAPDITAVLAEENLEGSGVVTFALPFEAAAESTGDELGDLDERTFEPLATSVLEDGGDQAQGLFSDDLETDPPRARSGLVVVELDAAASGQARAEASRAIARIVDDTPIGAARRSLLSTTAIEDGVEESLQRETPILLSVSLLLVVLVLALLFRSVVDVLVGLTGLLASIVWMVGFAAILGPGILGVTGAFNQVSIAVPVLLVGLGIDYSVHLTTRYREQRRRGDTPVLASRVALSTVGVALTLATAASVAGFLANVVTPLPPIRDFGIFAAIGIVAAFVVLGTGVPAARTLVDRRADRRRSEQHGDQRTEPADGAVTLEVPLDALQMIDDGPRAGSHDRPDADDGRTAAPAGPPGHRPARWSAALTTLATRRPFLALGITFALLVGGAVAAAGLSTEFDQRDFLPEGEPVLLTLDRLDEQFGGDTSEQTFLLADGDPFDPDLLEALVEVEDSLVELAEVRTTDGEAETDSVLSVRERIVESGEGVRERLADDLAAWDDPQAAAEDVPLPERIDADAVDGELDEQFELPEELEAALRERLPTDRSVPEALAATSDPDELEDDIREQLASDIAADRPDELSDAALARLADFDADELSLTRLEEEGFPLAEVDADDREQLARLEALEAAGDVRATDGEVLAAQVQVIREEVAEVAAGVLDDDGLLVSISTTAGQDGAAALTDDITRQAQPLAAAGSGITVVSEAIVNQEIIDELSAAQLIAIAISIVAATLLLVVATWFSARAIGLGLIGIVPSLAALVLVLASMRALGLAFNALTATVASIAVGIGVPYGIHLTNRFREGIANLGDPDRAVREALVNTGPALVGSAATTGLAFAVLMLSTSTPLRQFGIVSTLMIVLALLGCLLVQPALLVLWGRRFLITGGRRRGRERDVAAVSAPADVSP
ncbi:MAG: efflux RND transporter permease subunit [Nitriliruptoraceae bacterium]